MKDFLQLLLDRLKQVTGFKSVEMFNNQTTNTKTTDVTYPALFLELYGPISYHHKLTNRSAATVTVRVHVVTESPRQGFELDIYEQKDLVHRYLYQYTANGFFEPLMRTGELLETNHNNLYDYKIDYTTVFQEVTEPIEADQDFVVTVIDVEYDLYANDTEVVTDKLTN